MHFVTRAWISLLAGIGAGLVGFWMMWHAIAFFTQSDPAVGNAAPLVAAIFMPAIGTAFAVFRIISRPPLPADGP